MSYLRKPLEKLFQTPGHISVLRVLFPLREGISGREVSRRAEINDRNCRLILKRLEIVGIVSYQGTGKVRLYSLNRQHYMTEKFLSTLFNDERGMMDAVIYEIAQQLDGECVWAGLFGSAAKETDTVESDLDLIVLVAGQKDKESAATLLDTLQTELHGRFGVTLSPIVMTLHEWASPEEGLSDARADIISDHMMVTGDERVLE